MASEQILVEKVYPQTTDMPSELAWLEHHRPAPDSWQTRRAHVCSKEHLVGSASGEDSEWRRGGAATLGRLASAQILVERMFPQSARMPSELAWL